VGVFAAKQHNNPPAQHGGGAPATLAGDGTGMAEMSERFRETGSELYMGAGRREHD